MQSRYETVLYPKIQDRFITEIDKLKFRIERLKHHDDSIRRKILIFNITEPLQRNGLAFLDAIHSSNRFDVALFPRIISAWSVDCCPYDNVDKTGDYAKHWNVLCGSESSKTFNSMVELLEFLDGTYAAEELDILGTGAAYVQAELLKCNIRK